MRTNLFDRQFCSFLMYNFRLLQDIFYYAFDFFFHFCIAKSQLIYLPTQLASLRAPPAVPGLL